MVKAQAPMTRRRAALRRGAVLLALASAAAPAALLSSFLLVELFVNVFHAVLPRDLRIMWIRRSALPRTVALDRELGYVLRPDYQADFANGKGRLRIRHAPYPDCPQRGFRGDLAQVAPRADIAVVGDSILYGVEVDQEATMPAQLERLSGRRTVNLAITGYGTSQEAALYERCGAKLRPKLVLMFPYPNDPLDNVHFEQWRSSAAAQGLKYAKWCMIFGVPWPSRSCDALIALNKRLTLGDVLVHQLGRRIKFASLHEPAVSSRGVETMCRDMTRLRASTRRQGADLAVIFPEQWTFFDSPRHAALGALRDCARRLDVPALDLGADREALPLRVGRLDGHWTEAGHREAAEKVWRFLLKEGLAKPVPRAAAPAPSTLPAGDFIPACNRPDDRLGHSYTPGCSGWRVWAGRRVEMRYNALGLRDKDYPPRPSPGALRLLAAGGSIIAGSGLAEEHGPAKALERSLRRRGLNAEVINAAGEGYTGWQNAVALPDYLEAYSPHAVLYYLPSHHVFTDRSLLPRLRLSGGRVIGRRGARFPGLTEPLERARASWSVSQGSDDAGLDDLLGPTLTQLRQMREECRRRGARFLVAYDGEPLDAELPALPRRPSLAARLSQRFLLRPFRVDGARLERRLKQEGFELLPLSGDAGALAARESRLDGDYHWNERGAELFGEAAARALLRERRRPGPSPGSTGPTRDRAPGPASGPGAPGPSTPRKPRRG